MATKITLIEAINRRLFDKDKFSADEFALKDMDKAPVKYRDLLRAQFTPQSYHYGDYEVDVMDVKTVLDEVLVVQSTVVFYNGDPSSTPVQLNKLYGLLSKALKCPINEVIKYVEDKQRELVEQAAANIDVYDSSRIDAAFSEIMTNEGIVYSFKNDQWKIADPTKAGSFRIITELDVRNILVDRGNLRSFNADSKFKSSLLLGRLDAYKLNYANKKFFNMQSNLTYVPDEQFRLEYCAKWHKALRIEQDLDLFTAVMCKFIWQIKRCIFDMSTYNEIMVAIFGAQGIGKTFLANALFRSILGDYYDNSITLERLCDERNTNILMDNYCINIEELAMGNSNFGLRGPALAVLKRIITERGGSYRPMNTNSSVKIINNASLMSNANFHLYDILNDPSGMRRFIEFTSAQPKNVPINMTCPDEVKFLIENAVRFAKSINTEEQYGYINPDSEVEAKLIAIQNSYIKLDSFTEFFHATFTLMDADSLPNNKLISKKAISALYKAYRLDNGIADKFAVVSFESKLQDLVPENSRKKIHNTWHYALSQVVEPIEYATITQADKTMEAISKYTRGLL